MSHVEENDEEDEGEGKGDRAFVLSIRCQCLPMQMGLGWFQLGLPSGPMMHPLTVSFHLWLLEVCMAGETDRQLIESGTLWPKVPTCVLKNKSIAAEGSIAAESQEECVGAALNAVWNICAIKATQQRAEGVRSIVDITCACRRVRLPEEATVDFRAGNPVGALQNVARITLEHHMVSGLPAVAAAGPIRRQARDPSFLGPIPDPKHIVDLLRVAGQHLRAP
ncbi:hypothetical protein EYF80_001616 [Liparis tanakae]|uniref:Uncharacterized protein n=1 Tax=Liparis tanakae TaxID=230148 RepID=A0A4Z2JCK3_9TELE|nr:hypothetical protein EYF80_001616 [Liparis tanakae]